MRQMDRRAAKPRIADKMSAGRKRGCDQGSRWTARGIKAKQYWHPAGCALNLFWKLWRFDGGEIDTELFKVRDEFRTSHDADDFKIT